MSDRLRKKSPRAPAMPLEEAVERALIVYDKEQRHPAPTDVVARDIGYKSANNGAALAAIAALTGYGLLERPSPGKLAASPEIQSFKFAPNEELRKRLLKQWVKKPPVFEELINKYEGGLPSDATIRYDLIHEGFKPDTAESVLKAFKASIDYSDYYGGQIGPVEEDVRESAEPEPIARAEPAIVQSAAVEGSKSGIDRIPVRLDAERRAWLEIPTPFYEADKKRLKAQIDILLTDDMLGNVAKRGE